jgi:hypothetical protein
MVCSKCSAKNKGLNRCLKELDLRYFDPTQAYTDNRVNKGLVEALMLKRARCTVYSVQDTDTLGKHSELASTLAQGKPVIAYIPDLDPDDRARQLVCEAPATILERLRFVPYADEQFAQRLTDQELSLLDRVQDELIEYCAKRIWLSIADEEAVNRLRQTLGDDLGAFCRIVAMSEKAVYDQAGANPEGFAPTCAAGESGNWGGEWRSRGAEHCGLRGLASLHLAFCHGILA